MLLNELVSKLKKDPRAVALQLTVPVLLLERLGEGSQASWESTSALYVGKHPKAPNPPIYFVEKVPRTGNAFALGVTIGRFESNDIVVDDSSISRFHAWIQLDPKKGWLVCDAESKNGTQLDGELLASGAKVPLHDGAVIGLGQASLRFLLPQTFIELFMRA
jgi:pSer/pThr/pTyr-binding forkhead associated (FHA) protein